MIELRANGRTSLGTLRVAASACCFGTIPVFTVLATQRGGAPLPSVLAWRYALGAAALAVVGGGLAGVRVPRRRALALLTLGGGGQALVAYLGLSALRYIPAATVAFLFYTYPAWVTLLAAARRTERLDARRLLALALALGGIATLVGSPRAAGGRSAGVLLALGAAVVYALYIPLIGRLQRDVSAAAASAWVSAGACVVYVAGGLAAGALVPSLTPVAWASVAGLALVSTTLGFILFLDGLAALGPVRTAIISTIEPFCTAVLGALLLAQPLTGRTALGGVMVAGAVVILQMSEVRGRGV
jgi:drug/metabolite transporter (DMT)-like permease